MTECHVIRLRGPWQYQPLARAVLTSELPIWETSELPEAGTVKMPCDWSTTLGADFFGRVQYRRRFGRPTGLTERNRVDLVFREIAGSAQVRLDGVLLGEIASDDGEVRFDLSGSLQPRNELVVDVEQLPDNRPGGIVGDVQLEILTL